MKVKLLKKLRKRIRIYTNIDEDGVRLYSVRDSQIWCDYQNNFYLIGNYIKLEEAKVKRNDAILKEARRYFEQKRIV